MDSPGAFVSDVKETSVFRKPKTGPPVNSPQKACRILRGYQTLVRSKPREFRLNGWLLD
jgi:hypothetical protein